LFIYLSLHNIKGTLTMTCTCSIILVDDVAYYHIFASFSS